jgi:hypothetical protein
MTELKPLDIAIFSDTHIRHEKDKSDHCYPSDQSANRKNRFIIRQINKLAPALVIHLGDIQHPIPALPAHEATVKTAQTLFRQLNCKMVVVPGNHDVGDKPHAFAASPIVSRQTHIIFNKYWGSSFYAFDIGNCHFVVVNSSILNSGIALERKQQVWLERELEKNQGSGRRVFLFMHYPLYLDHPTEDEHYDNIGKQARMWLLSLLGRYNIEAVFSGHVHNFFYNRYKKTDLYVLPSVTFVRPEFSELFNVEPADECGRNDVNKLGFFLLRINADGHRIHPIRTYGRTRDKKNSPVLFSAGCPSRDYFTSIGVSLRHSWAKSMDLPFDGLDEFVRKPVRNDYLLQALWELRIQKLRIPIGDLKDKTVKQRIKVLKNRDHEFTVFSVGVPDTDVQKVIAANEKLLDSWEVILPRRDMNKGIALLRAFKQKIRLKIYLSKINTIDDLREEKDFQFSHFPTHGFSRQDRQFVQRLIRKDKTGKVLDGFVFLVPCDGKPFSDIHSVSKFITDEQTNALIHLKMSRKTEGAAFEDDQAIANIVAESIVCVHGLSNVSLFLDTFVHHDRGYYPRNGLIDRRYDPQLPYYITRHLNWAFAEIQDAIEVKPIRANRNVRAFLIQSSFRCKTVLVLFKNKAQRVELMTAPDGFKIDKTNWLSLYTGRTERVLQTRAAKNRTVFTLPSKTNHPGLLIFD